MSLSNWIVILILAVATVTGCTSRNTTNGPSNLLDPRSADYKGPEGEKLPMKNSNYGFGVYNWRFHF